MSKLASILVCTLIFLMGVIGVIYLNGVIFLWSAVEDLIEDEA